MAKRKEEETEQRKRVSWSESLAKVEYIPQQNSPSIEKDLEVVELPWRAPKRIRGEQENINLLAWVSGRKDKPKVKELPLPENKRETVQIPLIDLTTRNYIPRIRYEALLEGDSEVELLLN